MNPKFPLAILLALAVLLAPTSASPLCSKVYDPVCCWKSTVAGPPMTESSKCVCESSGGYAIFPGHCGPIHLPATRAPAGAFARMPVAAPVAAPAAPSVARAEYRPYFVCCYMHSAPPTMLPIWECEGAGGVPAPPQYCSLGK